MTAWRSFRTAPICWLREGGEAVDSVGAPADPRRARVIALSRGLCRFEFYRPAPGLTGARAMKAARLRAEGLAPFAAADWVLLRSRDGVAIWWWDADRVGALLGALGLAYDPNRLAPESLVHAPAEGWRLVRTVDGCEAQYWRAGVLQASTWRRRPFTAEQWAAFAHAVDAPQTPAPERPGPVGVVPDARRARAAIRPGRPAGWPAVERWAATGAIGAAALGACFTAQAFYYEREAAAALARAEALRAGAAGPAAARTLADLALIRGFQTQAAAGTPLLAAADLFRVCRDFDLQPTSWSVDAETLRVRLPLAEPDVLAEVATALEAEPSLRGVAVQSDGSGEAVTLTAEVVTGHG